MFFLSPIFATGRTRSSVREFGADPASGPQLCNGAIYLGGMNQHASGSQKAAPPKAGAAIDAFFWAFGLIY